MSLSYTNYRWEKPGRKGDRYYYKRDVQTIWRTGGASERQEQVVATVTYDDNHKSPHWGKWHVAFGAQSPELYALAVSDIPKFSSKDDAIAWTTAMVRLSI